MTVTEKYSQYNEQEYILDAVKGIDHGRLLDLGAWHATQFSNSRALIAEGWSAILVEPSPKPFEGLLREYGNNPNITLINGCIGFDRGFVKMHVTEDAVSTTDEATYQKWQHAGGYYGSFYSPQFTLGDLLSQFGGLAFHFVNIDTEGTSVDVFAAWMETLNRPQCFCVEHDSRVVELAQHAEGAGYRIAHTNGTNLVLSK